MTASLGSSTTPEIMYAGFRVAEAFSAGDTCELAAIEPNTSTQMKAWLTTPAIRKLCRFKPQPTLSPPWRISHRIQSSAAEFAGGDLPRVRRLPRRRTSKRPYIPRDGPFSLLLGPPPLTGHTDTQTSRPAFSNSPRARPWIAATPALSQLDRSRKSSGVKLRGTGPN